jgi:hypothetical protein
MPIVRLHSTKNPLETGQFNVGSCCWVHRTFFTSKRFFPSAVASVPLALPTAFLTTGASVISTSAIVDDILEVRISKNLGLIVARLSSWFREARWMVG